ncbi:MAG TPA: hypothetical protein VFD19_01050, partial [Clostridia bacterium]|nr:hypothetical protein [Clostridia bacterium]
HIYNKGITLQGMGKANGTTIQRNPSSGVSHRILFIEGPTGSYNPAVSTVINGFTIKMVSLLMAWAETSLIPAVR